MEDLPFPGAQTTESSKMAQGLREGCCHLAALTENRKQGHRAFCITLSHHAGTHSSLVSLLESEFPLGCHPDRLSPIPTLVLSILTAVD